MTPQAHQIMHSDYSYVHSRLLITVICLLILSGCSNRVKHNPLSPGLFQQVDFSSSIPERWWGDSKPDGIDDWMKASIPELQTRYPEAFDQNPSNNPRLDSLMISGGGANGAFGAGLLSGWTQSGLRPAFQYVTGVSTGALIAPFAFLGSDYDDLLLELYSSVNDETIFERKSLFSVPFTSSVRDTYPLASLIQGFITQTLIEEIGRQRLQGRLLLIITTHFDAQRPVVWDIGAIANNRGDQALALIHKVLLASAAVPVYFPPIPIAWEINGNQFTELHVDGAVTRNIYAYPAQVNLKALDASQGASFQRRIFVIQNSNLTRVYQPAETSILSMATRAISMLALSQARSDIERIYYLAERDGLEFNMIAIPDTYETKPALNFDARYMQNLIELGSQIGRQGDFWQHIPPSLE